MATITAADVNNLRKITGAGMMDCKNALAEADGDTEKAIDILRKKGQKVAAKRADKEANEGIVIARTSDDKTYGAVIMINCETDFVAKNQEFADMAEGILNAAIMGKSDTIEALLESKLSNGRTVNESITDMVGKIGEKINLAHFNCITAPAVYAYTHQGSRLATIVGLSKAGVANIDEIGKDVAMQAAAMNPVALDKENVPQSVIDNELEVGKEQARLEGKPENMLDKIAAGKLNKFFKDNTLLNQDFIRDGHITVRDYLVKADKELTVKSFNRLMLGGY